MNPPDLTADERSRYLRHLLLDEVGERGQRALKGASVLCVGAGGLGSPALLYLAAAGVGRIGIVDADTVDASNLQRQVLFDTSDVGKSKAERARAKLLALNPCIEVEAFPVRLDETNGEQLLSGFDAIMDGTDNFSTRYLVNDLALKLGKPNFFGCIFKFTGQVSVFGVDPAQGCYRCVFPVPPSGDLAPDCARAGVLGVLPGMVGTYQALEFLKWKLGIGTLLSGKLMMIDTLSHGFRTLRYAKNPSCPSCRNPAELVLGGYDFACATEAAGAARWTELSVHGLKDRQRESHAFFLLDVRERVEHELGNLGGAWIPVDQLADQANLLPADRDHPIVVYCRSGGRSARACAVLDQLGYSHVENLKGGALAWQREIDPTLKV
ncbi:MAG TPA: ThiF family adenylyltransferase [Kofleriaceae bacterium]